MTEIDEAQDEIIKIVNEDCVEATEDDFIQWSQLQALYLDLRKFLENSEKHL